MNRLLSVLLWSIIAAAFIGPGTVTTAASAGAGHRLALLWALAFSTAACLVLQEAAARLTVVSGRELGGALRRQYAGGPGGLPVLLLVLGAVVAGCAAYEAGNILGGVAGAVLGTGWPARWLTLASGGLAAVLLAFGAPRTVARVLSLLVAVMGVAFLATACLLRPPLADVIRGTVLPSLPPGSGVLVLGLVGTTVVPYNLFLGSGLAAGQRLSEVRFGLTVAVLLGGIISMGVLVVGSAVTGPFSFAALADVLADRLGGGARGLFAAGLFAAGLSSAVTAPLAAAITARGLFARAAGDARWASDRWRYRAVWSGVLGVGLAFGLAGTPPIPAIVLAQALNGILLPLVAVFLLLAVNDSRLMHTTGLNGPAANTAMSVVVGVSLVLGAANVVRAAATALGLEPPRETTSLALALAAAALLGWPLARAVARRRSGA